MKKHTYADSSHIPRDGQLSSEATPTYGELPNRLMTAFEVADFVGCHEETVRRAYLRGLLTSQRFGVRGRRFHPVDVLDWIKRGAPTRLS
jgi:excisionase family DNA binding protein